MGLILEPANQVVVGEIVPGAVAISDSGEINAEVGIVGQPVSKLVPPTNLARGAGPETIAIGIEAGIGVCFAVVVILDVELDVCDGSSLCQVFEGYSKFIIGAEVTGAGKCGCIQRNNCSTMTVALLFLFSFSSEIALILHCPLDTAVTLP